MLEARRLTLKSAPDELSRAYDFWRESWSNEFASQQIQGIDTVHSDDFRTADVVRTVEVEQQIGSLLLVSYFNLALPWDRDSSYFEGYPMELKKLTGTAMALRYFMVSKQFRRRPDLRLGAAVLCFCALDFLHSDANVLVGMALKKYGAHNLTAKVGFRPLGPSGAKKHGVDVEYVYATKEMVDEAFVYEHTRSILDNGQSSFSKRAGEDLDGFVSHEEAARLLSERGEDRGA